MWLFVPQNEDMLHILYTFYTFVLGWEYFLTSVAEHSHSNESGYGGKKWITITTTHSCVHELYRCRYLCLGIHNLLQGATVISKNSGHPGTESTNSLARKWCVSTILLYSSPIVMHKWARPYFFFFFFYGGQDCVELSDGQTLQQKTPLWQWWWEWGKKCGCLKTHLSQGVFLSVEAGSFPPSWPRRRRRADWWYCIYRSPTQH